MTKISCVVANIEQNGVEFVMAGGPLAVPLMSVEIEGFLFLYNFQSLVGSQIIRNCIATKLS